MKNKPIAITVPKTTKNFCDDNRNDRNPRISVVIATIKAEEVRIVPDIESSIIKTINEVRKKNLKK